MSNVFPRLPVLDSLVERVGPLSLGRTGFVCVQHLVETTGSLIESLLALGAEPRNVYILGKCYSSCPDVVRVLREVGVHVYEGPLPDHHGFYYEKMESAITALWVTAKEAFTKRNVDRIIVLDDGGQCIKHHTML